MSRKGEFRIRPSSTLHSEHLQWHTHPHFSSLISTLQMSLKPCLMESSYSTDLALIKLLTFHLATCMLMPHTSGSDEADLSRSGVCITIKHLRLISLGPLLSKHIKRPLLLRQGIFMLWKHVLFFYRSKVIGYFISSAVFYIYIEYRYTMLAQIKILQTKKKLSIKGWGMQLGMKIPCHCSTIYSFKTSSHNFCNFLSDFSNFKEYF